MVVVKQCFMKIMELSFRMCFQNIYPTMYKYILLIYSLQNYLSETVTFRGQSLLFFKISYFECLYMKTRLLYELIVIAYAIHFFFFCFLIFLKFYCSDIFSFISDLIFPTTLTAAKLMCGI